MNKSIIIIIIFLYSLLSCGKIEKQTILAIDLTSNKITIKDKVVILKKIKYSANSIIKEMNNKDKVRLIIINNSFRKFPVLIMNNENKDVVYRRINSIELFGKYNNSKIISFLEDEYLSIKKLTNSYVNVIMISNNLPKAKIGESDKLVFYLNFQK